MCSLRLFVPLLGMTAMLTATRHAIGQSSDSGTVTGHVYCADTQRPARFANIRLRPAEERDARFGGFASGRGGFATTGSDGSFRITGIAPGDYYADVMMPGYIQPLADVLSNLQSMTAADRDRIASQLTRVSVAANQTANIQIMIYRGGTINGTVIFDDGAPAAGVAVQALILPAGASGTAPLSTKQANFAGFTRTDDRGHFRLTGLADGTYIVLAAPRSIFPVYYGNTVERTQAKRLDVHAGDESSGADIQIPAAGMHRVGGVAISEQDGHPLARASVQLRLGSGDNGTISATTAPDGTFTFNAVPDGKFTILIVNAYDPATHTEFASSGQSLEVSGGDVTDLVLNATPRTD